MQNKQKEVLLHMAHSCGAPYLMGLSLVQVYVVQK